MAVQSAELAKLASVRAIPKEIKVLNTVTRFWHYPAQAADAKTVIFIHGYRGNHRGLEAIVGALPELNVIIPDLPGFGLSTEFDGEHSIENYSLWLAGFISGLKLPQKPILLGHSFGSIICSAFAADCTEIEALILENPVSAPALEGPSGALSKIAQAFFGLSGKLPLEAGLWLLKSWPMVRGMSIVMTKSTNLKLRKWVHAQHDANFSDFASRRVAIEGYRASISHNVGEYAPRFRVPVLAIIGSRDDITSVKQQETMLKTISTPATMVTLNTGHLTHYEKPLEVAYQIRHFAQEVLT
jgi:pimeloyl-ACP methyl ester carboxylesterase